MSPSNRCRARRAGNPADRSNSRPCRRETPGRNPPGSSCPGRNRNRFGNRAGRGCNDHRRKFRRAHNLVNLCTEETRGSDCRCSDNRRDSLCRCNTPEPTRTGRRYTCSRRGSRCLNYSRAGRIGCLRKSSRPDNRCPFHSDRGSRRIRPLRRHSRQGTHCHSCRGPIGSGRRCTSSLAGNRRQSNRADREARTVRFRRFHPRDNRDHSCSLAPYSACAHRLCRYRHSPLDSRRRSHKSLEVSARN